MCERCFPVLEKFSKSLLRKNVGPDIRVNVSSSAQKAVLREYTKAKAFYGKSLQASLSALQSGSMTRAEFLAEQKSSARLAYVEAFLGGKRFSLGATATITTDERRMIANQVNQEMQFMAGFADDVLSGSGTMPYRKRMSMYVDGLDAVFGFGRLAYLPDDVKIIWTLGSTDKHCIDCLANASGNPYTKRTLPGYPKSGSTRCLSNCKCRLEYVYGADRTSSDYNDFVINKVSGQNVPSEMDYVNLMQMREDYYYNKLMFEKTRDSAYTQSAMDSLRQYKAYQRNNGFSVDDKLPVLDVIRDFRIMNGSSSFTFLDPSTTPAVTYNAFVGVFVGNDFQYGRIKEIMGGNIKIEVFGGRTVLAEIGRSIVFMEKP